MQREEFDEEGGNERVAVTEEGKKYDGMYDMPIEKDDLDANILFNEGADEGIGVAHEQM